MPKSWLLAIFLILIATAVPILNSVLTRRRTAVLQARQDVRRDRYGSTEPIERIVPTPVIPRAKIITVAVLILAGISFLSAFVYSVPARTIAFPTRFGAVQEPMRSGVHIADPFLDTSNQWDLTFQQSTMTGVPGCDPKGDPSCRGGDNEGGDAVDVRGSDNGLLWVDVTIRYKIDPAAARSLFNDFRSLDRVRNDLVRARARAILRDQFSRVGATDAIAKDRAALATGVTADLREQLTPYGLIVDTVDIRGITPDKQVDAAISAKLQATQAAEQALITQQQQVTEAETRKQVAERDAAAARTAAQGWADAAKIKADGEAYSNERVAASVTEALTRYLMAQNIGKAGSVIYLPADFGGLLNLSPPK